MTTKHLKKVIDKNMPRMFQNQISWVIEDAVKDELKRLMKLKTFKAKFRKIVRTELERTFAE